MRFQDQLDAMIAGLPPQAAMREAERAARLVALGGTSVAAVSAIARNAAIALDTRLFAGWVLGRLDSPAAEATLIALLEQESPQLRVQAAQSLGNFPGKGAVEALGKALRDSERDVRKLAAHALGWMHDEAAVGLLLATLNNRRESAEVRGMAAEALGNAGSAQAIEPLIHALADASAEVRFWAVYALGELGDPRALPKLHDLTADGAEIPGFGTVGAQARQSIAQILTPPGE